MSTKLPQPSRSFSPCHLLSRFSRFGDITTLAWWNDLWLNEGGASYWEWMGVKAYSGHAWAEDSQLIADSQASALALDASQYSHPIVQHVGDPDEVDSLFDSISYGQPEQDAQ